MSAQQHAVIMAGFLVGLVALALLGRRRAVTRLGWPPKATSGLLVTVAVCLALTVPDQIHEGVVERFHACVSSSSARTFPGGPVHHLVNVAGWVPLGCLGVLATRRPLAVTVGASLLWACVELAQTLDPMRSCQPVDWAENTAGALAGALLGLLLLRRAASGTEGSATVSAG